MTMDIDSLLETVSIELAKAKILSAFKKENNILGLLLSRDEAVARHFSVLCNKNINGIEKFAQKQLKRISEACKCECQCSDNILLSEFSKEDLAQIDETNIVPCKCDFSISPYDIIERIHFYLGIDWEKEITFSPQKYQKKLVDGVMTYKYKSAFVVETGKSAWGRDAVGTICFTKADTIKKISETVAILDKTSLPDIGNIEIMTRFLTNRGINTQIDGKPSLALIIKESKKFGFAAVGSPTSPIFMKEESSVENK